MLCLDISFPTPQEDILFDDALLFLAEQGMGGEILRFWEASRIFIVLGRVSKIEEDLKIQPILDDHIVVVRRSSGGGTVVQGPGCLNYTLVLSKEKNAILADLKKSYEFILSKVVEALKPCGVAAHFLPISDIALLSNHKKISGNAQKRGRHYILHHGTLLYDFDLSTIEKYLKMPSQIPDYRRARPHLEFVANVEAGKESIKDSIRKCFKIKEELKKPSQQQLDTLKKFLAEKNVLVDLKG